jgi:hypothetical protein
VAHRLGIRFVNRDSGGFVDSFAVRPKKRMAKPAEHSARVADDPSIAVFTCLDEQTLLSRFGPEVTYGGLAG